MTLEIGRRSFTAKAKVGAEAGQPRSWRETRMHGALPVGFGINLPPVPLMVEKKTGTAHISCVCLLRPLDEGYPSRALDLRACAMWAFRDEPAGRHAARRGRLAAVRQGSHAPIATPLKFSSARCAAAACPGVMEWQW